MKAISLTKAAINRFTKFVPPAGWEKTYTERGKTFTKMELVSDDVKLSIYLEHRMSDYGQLWGDMAYKVGDSWYTTARLGVESSFYHDHDKPLNELIEEQVKIAEERRAVNATLIDLPGIGFRVTQKRLESMTKQLRIGERVSLMPSGFGTGYTLTAGAVRRGAGWKRGSEQLQKVLRLNKPVYFQSFDAD